MAAAVGRQPAALAVLCEVTIEEAQQRSGLSGPFAAQALDPELTDHVVLIKAYYLEDGAEAANRMTEEVSSAAVLDESLRAGMIRRRTENGAFKLWQHRGGRDNPLHDQLEYFRSYTNEELDQLEIKLEWDPSEAPDREPDTE